MVKYVVGLDALFIVALRLLADGKRLVLARPPICDAGEHENPS
jgi:hypothetical protein